MIWEAIEESTVWLDGFSQDWLPAYAYDHLRVYHRRDSIGIRAEQVAGTIPLLNGDVLRVTPKVGKVALLHMLFRTAGIDQHLQQTDVAEAFGTSEDRSPEQLIARSYAKSLGRISSSSPLFRRRRVATRSNYFSGRVQALQTSLALRRNDDQPVHSRTMLRDFDIPENRMLGAAARRATSLLDSDSDSFARQQCKRWIAKFGTSMSKADLVEVDKNFRRGNYSGSRGYYDEALTLARVLLGLDGIDINGTDVAADCVLVDMPDLFERYVRKVLADVLGPAGLLVSKEESATGRALYVDGSYQLLPDIMIHKHSNLLLIADAKYKKPDSKDHYQIICYLDRHACDVGILVSPSRSGRVEEKLYRTQDNRAVWEISVPLDDMQVTADTLATLPTLAA